MLFKTLEEYYEYVNYLEQIEPTEENILKLKNFLKFSPNKFARKLGIDEMIFQKEYNEIKGRIHRKYLYDKEYIKLASFNPKSEYTAHWTKVKSTKNQYGGYETEARTVMSIPCICIKDYMRMGEPKFYKNIKYLYYHFVGDGIKDHFVITSTDIKKEFTKKEFDEHFLDLREYKLRQLLD